MSSSSSDSTQSSSSSSSSSSADSSSRGSVPTTFRSAPHSSQLIESPSSTSSSSTSIAPSQTGHVTMIALLPGYTFFIRNSQRLANCKIRLSAGCGSGHPAARGHGHDPFEPQIHKELLAVRQLVLFDHLQHLQAGDLLAVEAGDDLGEKLGGTGGQFGQAAVQGLAQCGGQGSGGGAGGEGGKMALHFLAKIRRGQVGFPVQEHSGEAAAGVQDMPGDLAKGHELGGGLEVQLAGGAIFHRLNGVLPDGLPGVQDVLDAYHSTHCIRGAATWSREGRGMMPSCSDASFSGPRRPRERRPWRGRARCAGRYGSRAWKRTCSGSRRGTRITTPSTRSAPKAAGWCRPSWRRKSSRCWPARTPVSRSGCGRTCGRRWSITECRGWYSSPSRRPILRCGTSWERRRTCRCTK